jgi:hypothetical protein
MSEEKDNRGKESATDVLVDTAKTTAKTTGVGVIVGALVAGPVGAVMGGLWGAQLGFGYSCSKHGMDSDGSSGDGCS